MTEKINIPMGHIYQKAVVLGRDNDNKQWILENPLQKNRLLLKDCYIPADMPITRGEELVELVLIKYDKKVFHVAVANYQHDLISHYYCRPNDDYRPRRKNWHIWSNRWQKEYGEDFEKNITIDTTYETTGGDLYNDFFWLRGSDYVLPVFGYKDLGKLKGNLLFYPGLFSGNYQIARSVYKTDGVDTLPQKYTAKITGIDLSGSEAVLILKNISIFFHGFTYPTKWHYGVWKYVLALTPSALARKRRNEGKSEKNLWKELWNTKYEVQNTLFDQCREVKNKNDEGVTCDEGICLSLSLFEKIHFKLNIICRKYLEQFVTSFEVNTINYVSLFNGPFNSKQIVLTYMKRYNGIAQKTVLYGTCYDWNDTKPVFHISPVTLFLDNKYNKDWLSKNVIEDRTKRYNKNIFSGNLMELKKCGSI